MPYRDKKMYKNPRLPKAAEIQSTPGAARDRKEPTAPQRGGKGMLQMAAQARARQPKEGTPPIPTAAAPTTPAPTRAPGAVADPRALAARRMAGQGLGSQAMGGGGGQQPPQDPTDTSPQYKLGTELETQGPAEPITYGKPALGPVDTGLGPLKPMSDPWGMPAEGDPTDTTPASGTPDPEAAPPATTPAALPDVPYEPEPPKVKPKEATGYKEKGAPIYGWITKTDSAGSEYKSWGIIGYEEGVDVPADQEHKPDYEAQEATGYSEKGAPVYDKDGNIIGYEEGVVVPMKGWVSPWDEPADTPTGTSKDETKVRGDKYDRMEKFFMDYLEQATGIPPEELQGQIAGLEAAGYDQMAKFAQQMAARGMSTSGVTGQGMGQIMTQTMLGIANLKFENAKLAVEERMNKIKNFMAFYGNMMSEENKRKHLDELEKLERDKFNYDKDQNELSDKWVAVKNLLALTGSEKWDLDALGWAFRAIDNGVDPALIAEWLSSDGTTVSRKPGAPDYPGVEEGQIGPPPEGATGGTTGGTTGFGEGSASPKNAYSHFMTDDQYQQYMEYGQPPTELGWVEDPDWGLPWSEMSGSQRTTAMNYMAAKSGGFTDPPPGYSGSAEEWAEMSAAAKHKKWEGYVWGDASGKGFQIAVGLGLPNWMKFVAALGEDLKAAQTGGSWAPSDDDY